MSNKPGLNEGEYLALVERIQKAMCIEPFRPDVTDVVVLIGTVQVLNQEVARLRAREETARAAIAGSEKEIERLRGALETAMAQVEQLQELTTKAFGLGQLSGLRAPAEQIGELQAENERLRDALEMIVAIDTPNSSEMRRTAQDALRA